MSKVTYGPYVQQGLRSGSYVELRLSSNVWDDSYAWVEDTRISGFVVTEKTVGKKVVIVAMAVASAKDLLDYLEYYAGRLGPHWGVDPALRRAYKNAAKSVRRQLAAYGAVEATGRIGY